MTLTKLKQSFWDKVGKEDWEKVRLTDGHTFKVIQKKVNFFLVAQLCHLSTCYHHSFIIVKQQKSSFFLFYSIGILLKFFLVFFLFFRESRHTSLSIPSFQCVACFREDKQRARTDLHTFFSSLLMMLSFLVPN